MAFKNFWQKKQQKPRHEDLKFISLAPLEIHDDFVQACIERELSSLVQDILQPYIFEDARFDHVYDYGLKGLFEQTHSLHDVLMQAMMGQDVLVHQVYVQSGFGPHCVLMMGSREEIEEKLAPLKKDYLLDVRKSICMQKIYSLTDMALLKLCYRSLGYAYNRQERMNELDAKMILKMKGFHALFTAPRNDEEEAIALANRQRLRENFKEILEGRAGIIDREDDIGLLNANTGSGQMFKQVLEMIFQEIARILRIPITRLLGRAPQGMNATGESDALNYDMTLDSIRSGWLEPFLKLMGQEYQKVDKIDVAYLKQIAEMHILLGLPLAERFKNKIKALGEEL